MKTKILFAALVAVLSIPAAQAQGVGFGVGGTPPPFLGGGGDANADASARATALSNSTSSANAVQGQIQGQAQSTKVGVGVSVGGQSSTTTVGGQSMSMTYNEAEVPALQEIRSSGRVEVENVPDVVAPSAYPTAPCRIAVSAGGSGIGFGVSVGGSVLDEDCNRRELSRSFQNLGEGEAALAILCSHEGAEVAPVCKALVAEPEAPVASFATGSRPTSGFQYDRRSGERLCAYDEILANRTGLGVCP